MDTETSMDEFFDGMSDDYQSDDTAEETESATEEAEENSEAEQEAESAADAEENSGDADEAPSEEKTAEEKDEPRTYVLRVNHEDKVCTPEEYQAYAQKGADYDRVKMQLEQAKNDNSGLQQKIAEMQATVDIVSDLAKASNIAVPDLLKSFRKTRYTSLGYTDREAEMAVQRDDQAKELESLRGKDKQPAQESVEDRANREVAEFQSRYPNISLTEELVNKLMPDCSNGMSIVDAYRKMVDAEREAKIAELEAQLAAEKQNSENRKSSPGSLRDVGKKKARSEYDEFFDQF